MWSSFPRSRESSNLKAWIPAYAGMTIKFQGGGVNGYAVPAFVRAMRLNNEVNSWEPRDPDANGFWQMAKIAMSMKS